MATCTTELECLQEITDRLSNLESLQDATEQAILGQNFYLNQTANGIASSNSTFSIVASRIQDILDALPNLETSIQNISGYLKYFLVFAVVYLICRTIYSIARSYIL